jgi:hypothetical protein
MASLASETVRPELAEIDVGHMRGLEIGPLASPRVRKDEGPVRYVDHASATDLKQKYATDQGMRGRLDEIVDVDYVLGETTTIAEAVAGMRRSTTVSRHTSSNISRTRWDGSTI